MTILSRGFIVVLAAFAVVALATSAADTTSVFREQAELEAFEDFEPPRQLDLGGDLDSAFASATDADSLIQSSQEMEAETDADADADADADYDYSSNWDENTPLIARSQGDGKFVIVQQPEAQQPLQNPVPAKVINPDVIPMVPVVVQHENGLKEMVSPAQANMLLTRLYDRNPWSPLQVADRLPESARIALFKVLNKSNDPDTRVAITASFLAAFTTDNVSAESEAQEKSSSLLEADSDKAAMDNADMTHREDRQAIEAALLQMAEIPAVATATTSAPAAPVNAAAAPAPVAVPAAAAPAPVVPAEVTPAAASASAKSARDADNLDMGVVSLNKYSDVLMGEAQILSKKIEELQRLHGPSVFKAMNRGPVGRRFTPKDRQQVFTNGLHSWDAAAQNDNMRSRGSVPATEADRIFTVEPIPK